MGVSRIACVLLLPALLALPPSGGGAPRQALPALLDRALVPAGLRLVGTVVASDPARSSVLVETTDGGTRRLRIGEPLAPGLAIEGIHATGITVLRAGARYSMPVQGNRRATGPARRLPPSPAPLPVAGQARPAVAPAGGADVRAALHSKEAVTALCKDPVTLAALSEAERSELTASGLCP